MRYTRIRAGHHGRIGLWEHGLCTVNHWLGIGQSLLVHRHAVTAFTEHYSVVVVLFFAQTNGTGMPRCLP